MIQAALKIPVETGAAVAGDQPDVLNAVWTEEAAVAIWHRQLDAGFHDWLADLRPEKLPKARLQLRPTEVKAEVLALCEHHGILDDTYCVALAEDTASLATLFARVMQVDQINLRFDVVDNNACRKFHQDNVPARLLCTYRGRGTQYGAITTGPDPDSIEEMATGSAGLFRGRLFPGAGSSDVYHRSPSIEGTGETRLLLVIDSSACTDDCCF